MYRPLSQNEHVIVSRTIYEERGLTGGLAESMFLAYKARAMALDTPEFDVFKGSEIERKELAIEKRREMQNVTTLQTGNEISPIEFLKKLDSLSRDDKPSAEPKNCYEWFYGDETLLDNQHKRLCVKFYNSDRYRKQVLRRYLEDGILLESQLSDTESIGVILGEFHRKYPGTRQGIISCYEKFFGDASGFSYDMVLEREAFFNDPEYRAEFLVVRNLPKEWDIEAIKVYLKKSALDTEVLTFTQIEQWETDGRRPHD